LRSNALESLVPHDHESVGMRVRVEARRRAADAGAGGIGEDLTKGSLCLAEIGGCTAGRPARFNTKARVYTRVIAAEKRFAPASHASPMLVSKNRDRPATSIGVA
jgi:hypothetical protein